MNISRKWLREFVDITATDKEYDSVMTLAGQKVETTERMDAEIKNVVVGKVLSMKKHENSDHMWVCMVDCGSGEPVQIVTGAQNVHEGDLVPVAQHNSYLPGGIHITKGKLRGVESCGMLCSYKELGLTEHDCPEAYADGIWILNDEGCEVGEDMNVVIGNDDSIVEFEITNNRPDCYSLIGLARETAAAFNVPMKHHEPVVKGGAEGNLCDLLDVDVQADDLCPRYTARMVRNVKIAPSPKWMRQRLRSAGIRPINNIVDITNYVMVEYGQPMHAFDYRYVKGGKIVVRRAGEDKTLTTLDGNVRTLQPDMLVIADETKPVGLAGVMGGENSEIVDDTVDVVFESANFLGSSIRKTALALGMRTDASAKFEKDIDPMLTVPAVNRACELVELLGAGEVMDGMIDVLNYVPQPVTVKLEPERINALLGTDISEADMIEYLRREEVPVVDGMIQVPSWRPDLRVMADIAEEVARYYGYNNIETTLMRGATTMGGYSDEQKLENAAGVAARALGYSEIITYSFVSPSSFDAIRLPADSPLRKTVKLVNPLGEDTSIMRTVILPSMLDILSRNYAFKEFVARVIVEASSRTIELETGGVDIAFELAAADWNRIDENPETQLISGNTQGISYLCLNNSLAPIAGNEKLRKALAYGLDLESLVKAVWQGTADVADSYYSPTIMGHKTIGPREYDPEKAKELLAEAGYPDGLDVTYMTYESAVNLAFSEVLQNMWGQIGVNVTVQFLDLATFTQMNNAGEITMALMTNTASIPDPAAALIAWPTSRTISLRHGDSHIDELLQKGQQTYAEDERIAIYQELQDYLWDRTYTIPIAFPKGAYGARADVTNLPFYPDLMPDLTRVQFVG